MALVSFDSLRLSMTTTYSDIPTCLRHETPVVKVRTASDVPMNVSIRTTRGDELVVN